jgi:hypothetical protein
MPERPEPPWHEMFTAYVTDETVTLAALSERYGVSRGAVYERSAREKWRARRREFYAECYDEATAAAKADIAGKIGRFSREYLPALLEAGVAILRAMSSGEKGLKAETAIQRQVLEYCQQTAVLAAGLVTDEGGTLVPVGSQQRSSGPGPVSQAVDPRMPALLDAASREIEAIETGTVFDVEHSPPEPEPDVADDG